MINWYNSQCLCTPRFEGLDIVTKVYRAFRHLLQSDAEIVRQSKLQQILPNCRLPDLLSDDRTIGRYTFIVS
jgi:hypothetical protein